MNKKIKKEWLKALRSGEYKQGKYSLHKNGRFCCLGVLYDACLGDEWIYDVGAWGYEGDSEIETGGFDPAMCSRAGFSIDEAIALAVMNDNGKSFSEIADYIEKNL